MMSVFSDMLLRSVIRRTLLAATAVVAGLSLQASSSAAQEAWPKARPIKFNFGSAGFASSSA